MANVLSDSLSFKPVAALITLLLVASFLVGLSIGIPRIYA
jgi:hypothetical protein